MKILQKIKLRKSSLNRQKKKIVGLTEDIEVEMKNKSDKIILVKDRVIKRRMII